jgi:hypothetical protein
MVGSLVEPNTENWLLLLKLTIKNQFYIKLKLGFI